MNVVYIVEEIFNAKIQNMLSIINSNKILELEYESE